MAARRLREAANNLSDPQLKKELASLALQLFERAEAIARNIENPELIAMNIKRYKHMLAPGIRDETQRKIVEQFLADAEEMLANLQKQAP